jgi:hypothetical protein
VRVGEYRDDELGAARELARVCRELRAFVDERLRLAFRALPHAHFVPHAHQALRHRGAHSSRSCYTNLQSSLLESFI